MTTTPFADTTARHLIAGIWSEGGAERQSLNPATDEVLGSYFDADLAVAQAAIQSANAAFRELDWATNRELRGTVLWEIAAAIEANLERLALAISLENGKPLGQARFELSIAAPKLRYFAGLALTDSGSAAHVYPGSTSMLLKEPIGVAGIIVPWNSPAILAIRSLAPALAAGCTTVVKMPAQTALTNALLAEVLDGVESLPKGVINMFTESGDAGAKELVSSPDVHVVSYTGSTAVGARIASAAGERLKKVSLELGGKTPMIVFADADLDVVVPTLTAAVTTFAGQFCMTGSRILVERSISEDLKRRLIESLAAVRVGVGTEDDTEMGPLVDHAAVERVERIVAGVDPSRVLLRGGPIEGPGAFFSPALIEVQELSCALIQDEIFGPVATFELFDDEDDAVRRANATDFGLSASVWTRDGARSQRVAERIEAGTVWINAWAQILDQFEEGGFKKSGLGRLNGLGGLAEFQEVKHIFRSTV
ncbi:aldehyde dehydrogenase family protein [Amnibacterium flavum]|uniref:Aldehyde dehydrogenase n=1 Tax=Amnibacterium flavum TaxID=2173173 RepID=A0A2V1HRM5_9MICO|nr:aldehyde dehydrogenase family protein [Amnibacterium flavum]PVZ95235.1 aldehyde dehydrogenase [Amnibacterium flavum]